MTRPAKRLRGGAVQPPPPVPVDPDAPVVTDEQVSTTPAIPQFPQFAVSPFSGPQPSVVVTVPADTSEYEDAEEIPETVEGIVVPEFPQFPVASGDFEQAAMGLLGQLSQVIAEDADGSDRLDEIERKLDALIEATNILGQQNEWMVNVVQQMFAKFEAFMGGGNPMAFLGNMMGMGRKGKGTK